MRKDQKLSTTYQKNERFEKVITSLNNQLEISQRELLENRDELYPTIHILGAPRSGTTLVSQLIPSFLEVAHINNFISAFWKAPIYGIELSKKLIGQEYRSAFSSDFGRTNAINEPHEFGYFWNYHLKYDSLQQKTNSHEKLIDWDQLALLLNNMTDAFAKPIVFKSFLLGFHASIFYKNLPKSKFIYVKRNLKDNVISLIKLRKKLNGDINTWGSIKPRQYEKLKDLNIYEQIVGQILCLENEYINQLNDIPENNIIITTYEKICENPKNFLTQVDKSFLNQGSSLELNEVPIFSTNTGKIDSIELKKIFDAKAKILEIFPDLNIID